ncbi:cell division protein [Alistipes sp. Z76]|nr:cell division protein [Alistipes sp. Z76]NCE66908.1 cell division protein [Muribaculaceae bacterium M3]
MDIFSFRRYLAIALPFAGSAILLFSCEADRAAAEDTGTENLMTEYSENLSIVMSENGRKSYHFETPLLEGYGQARDPYREFRKGIKITMFEKDSTAAESAVLTSNYAINYGNRRLWEAKGDVVVTKSDGKKLFTSQLFWNQATGRIYSNVDSKIVDGDEVYNCEGFETDESMNDLTYRKLDGVTYFTSSEEAEAYASGSSDKEPASATSDSDAAASAAPAEDAD